MNKILSGAMLLMLALVACQSDKNSTSTNEKRIVLTADKGKPMGPNIKYMPEWKAFGWFTASDSVVWDVDISEAKEYEVHLEWSVSDEEAGKEFLLTAGNNQLTGTVAKSGSWETYKKEKVGSINLDEGPQKLVFKSNTKFDKGALLDFRQLTLEAAD